MKHYRRKRILRAVHEMYLANLPEPGAGYSKVNRFLGYIAAIRQKLEEPAPENEIAPAYQLELW